MDEYRRKIAIFFNEIWLKSEKQKVVLSMSKNMYLLRRTYSRVYNTNLSKSQIVELLISNELNRINMMPNYEGDYSSSNLTFLKDEYKLTKAAK